MPATGWAERMCWSWCTFPDAGSSQNQPPSASYPHASGCFAPAPFHFLKIVKPSEKVSMGVNNQPLDRGAETRANECTPCRGKCPAQTCGAARWSATGGWRSCDVFAESCPNYRPPYTTRGDDKEKPNGAVRTAHALRESQPFRNAPGAPVWAEAAV